MLVDVKVPSDAELLAEAIAICERAGYTVHQGACTSAKKETVKLRKRMERNGLNAIGRPYGPGFDPKYRMKHKPSFAHLFKPQPSVVGISAERWMEMCAEAEVDAIRRGLVKKENARFNPPAIVEMLVNAASECSEMANACEQEEGA